jgi:hypothetical protein
MGDQGVELNRGEAGYVESPHAAAEKHLAEGPWPLVDAETHHEQRRTDRGTKPHPHPGTDPTALHGIHEQERNAEVQEPYAKLVQPPLPTAQIPEPLRIQG